LAPPLRAVAASHPSNPLRTYGQSPPLTRHAHCAYILNVKFQEIERILLKDGWRLKAVNGSHHQYVHSTKRGKVTIPYHSGDLHPKTINAILKQAGLK
jgi:predicted RNA binding protein YcfA (HicA-like mRNA interferase family)